MRIFSAMVQVNLKEQVWIMILIDTKLYKLTHGTGDTVTRTIIKKKCTLDRWLGSQSGAAMG